MTAKPSAPSSATPVPSSDAPNAAPPAIDPSADCKWVSGTSHHTCPWAQSGTPAAAAAFRTFPQTVASPPSLICASVAVRGTV